LSDSADRGNENRPNEDSRWIALGEVTRPHGLAGEVRVVVYSGDASALAAAPRLRLVTTAGEVRPVQLMALKAAQGGFIARLAGVADRDRAEALRGGRLEIPRGDLGPTEQDEYYDCDLEGCAVEVGGNVVGRVLRVVHYPTCDTLVVERADGASLEVPLSGAYVSAVDVADKRIVLSDLDGLE
jgi:16S rRNA processing protein RimM